jgi:hypothetical protein
MTKLTFQLAVWSLAAGSLMGQIGSPVRVDVPFDFMAGDKSLAAGEYLVHTDASKIVWICGVHSSDSALVMSQSVPLRSVSNVGMLTFNKYGDRYFLSKVSTGGDTGNVLSPSRAEREYVHATLIAKKATPSVVSVAAQ